MRSEGGFVTIWVLGLCVVVLVLGGLVVDGWRVLETRRALVSAADAAAAAGADGLDEDALRHGVVWLEPVRAETLAETSLREERSIADDALVAVSASDQEVVVVLRERVPFGLGRFVVGSLDVSVSSRARPLRR
jgi:Flp pilus assembly protein TadG